MVMVITLNFTCVSEVSLHSFRTFDATKNNLRCTFDAIFDAPSMPSSMAFDDILASKVHRRIEDFSSMRKRMVQTAQLHDRDDFTTLNSIASFDSTYMIGIQSDRVVNSSQK